MNEQYSNTDVLSSVYEKQPPAIAAFLDAGFTPRLIIPVAPPNAKAPWIEPKNRGKTPSYCTPDLSAWLPLPNWQHGVSSTELDDAAAAGGNVGLILGTPLDGQNFIFLDLDSNLDHPDEATLLCAVAHRVVAGRLGNKPFWWRSTVQGRSGILFRLPSEVSAGRVITRHVIHKDTNEATGSKLEILASVKQVCVGGQHAKSGREITWQLSDGQCGPRQAPPLEEVPLLTSRADLEAMVDEIGSELLASGLTLRSATNKSATPTCAPRGVVTVDKAPPSAEILIDLLNRLPNAAGQFDREDYLSLMMAVVGCQRALLAQGIPSADLDGIRYAALSWACRWTDAKGIGTSFEQEARKFDEDFAKQPEVYAGWHTVKGFAKRAGLDMNQLAQLEAEADFEALEQPPKAGEQKNSHPKTPNTRITELTEDAVALAFAAKYADRFRYDQKDCFWYVYDPLRCWVPDDRKSVESLARNFVRTARTSVNNEAERRAASKIAFSTAVHRACQSDPRMSVCTQDWNNDPFVLGIPGGYVDLRDGRCMPANGEDLIRKRTAVAPASEGTLPTVWLHFLNQATGGDKEKEAFLQRYAGYILTGDMREEQLAFFHGPGGNGKGVFVNSLASVLGDYAYRAPTDMFKADSRINREYQLAEIEGRRLVVASETEAGVALAESFVKELTGNEGEIEARRPYGKPFNFKSCAKLLIVGNHAPRLQGRTAAMERRLTVVPFTHQPPAPDRTLKERLIPEYPAILRWAIEGCLAWQREGLGSCAAIAEASHRYFDDQDLLGQWLQERCTAGHDQAAASSAVLADYNEWLRHKGEQMTSSRALKEELTRKPGIGCKRTSAGMMFTGISINAASSFLQSVILP